MSTHRIRLVGITGELGKERLIQLGFIFIEDRKQVVFNPSYTKNKIHWTWHKDGKFHAKDRNGQKLFSVDRIPLSTFKGQYQMLSSATPLQQEWKLDEIHKEYKHTAFTDIFAIDLRNYKKQLNLSIHLASEDQIANCSRVFHGKNNHQVYVYVKSEPYLIVHAFGS